MEKWFWFGAAGACIAVAIVLLIAGPAEGAETQYEVQDSRTSYKPADERTADFTVHEFTPKSAQGMQCVFARGGYNGGVFCWPKIMNTEVQKWIERMEDKR